MKRLILALLVLGNACAAVPPPEAVWSPPADFLDKIHARLEKGREAHDALQDVMQAEGAKPAARAFAGGFADEAGYLLERKVEGKVVTGTVAFPLRAGNLDEPLLADSAGRLIRPTGADQPPVAELAQHKVFRRLPNRKRLEAYPPLEPYRVEGTDVVFDYPLRASPREPETGTARVAFRFDAAGKYLGRRVLSVKRAR